MSDLPTGSGAPPPKAGISTAQARLTGLLYRLFAAARPWTALTAAGFSLVGISILAVAGLLHLVPLLLLDPAPLAQAESIGQFALQLHGSLYGISLFFFGLRHRVPTR